eukprot:2531600-Rhodomonas_salina.1
MLCQLLPSSMLPDFPPACSAGCAKVHEGPKRQVPVFRQCLHTVSASQPFPLPCTEAAHAAVLLELGRLDGHHVIAFRNRRGASLAHAIPPRLHTSQFSFQTPNLLQGG